MNLRKSEFMNETINSYALIVNSQSTSCRLNACKCRPGSFQRYPFSGSFWKDHNMRCVPVPTYLK